MPVTKDQIWQALKTVADPQRGADIVTLNQVRSIAACDGVVIVRVTPLDAAAHTKDSLRRAITSAVLKLGDEIVKVTVEIGDTAPTSQDVAAAAAKPSAPSQRPAATPPPAASSPQTQARSNNPLPLVKRIIAVGAGKGGVGKSTVAVNLAVGLARRGLKVGLLDGDIYGPSAPTLLGLAELPVNGTQQILYPFEVHGIKAMTIGKLVEPEKPLIWRGPMAHGAFRQLAVQTDWGDLDYLIIDLPPGTGDVPLTMSQMLPLSGAVIVCTPQKVAQDDAVRAAAMFKQLDIPVLGIVENMSYFIGDDGKEYDIFGKGGAAKMAEHLGLPLLAQVPLTMALRVNSDGGDPTANFKGAAPLAAALNAMVERTMEEIEAHATDSAAPTLSVH